MVEDDPDVLFVLQRGLELGGHVVDTATAGADGLARATDGDYDAIVLDVDLPRPDGLEVCRELRRREVWTPILLLTAMAEVRHRVAGLDAGADDFLPKPFALDELEARLRAITRRVPVRRPVDLEAAGISLDLASLTVQRDGRPVSLPRRAVAVLAVFLRQPGVVLSRETIVERAWGTGAEAGSNLVDVYVRQLRLALDRPYGRSSFETVRGAGYRLNPDR